MLVIVTSSCRQQINGRSLVPWSVFHLEPWRPLNKIIKELLKLCWQCLSHGEEASERPTHRRLADDIAYRLSGEIEDSVLHLPFSVSFQHILLLWISKTHCTLFVETSVFIRFVEWVWLGRDLMIVWELTCIAYLSTVATVCKQGLALILTWF